MTKRYVSLDMDGCLFHRKYYKSKDIIEANKPFLDGIKKTNSIHDQTVVMIGSNRQSWSVDSYNAFFGKDSCFPAIRIISDYLKATLNPFLLADLYGELKEGTSYQRAITEDFEGTHAEWRYDESKVSVLYAQMHNAALANPDQTIIFDFYDDKTDILDGLKEFYTKNSLLIPFNVQLNLHQYNGKEVKEIATLQGQGMIDSCYQQTVRDMAEICIRNGQPSGYDSKFMYFNRDVKTELLKRIAYEPPISQQSASCNEPVASPLLHLTKDRPIGPQKRRPSPRIPRRQLANHSVPTIEELPLLNRSPSEPVVPQISDADTKNNTNHFNVFNISMQVFSGFIVAAGITAIALAITLLNATTLGTAGLVTAGIGVTAVLAGGTGFFAANRMSSKEPEREEACSLNCGEATI